ncbi:MAG: hypothetical protein U5K69_03790 [Balneolaceae bacterium]|nr:hypothetical protein [Balneolaceae bacterium]
MGLPPTPVYCAKIGVADFEGHIAKICDLVSGDVSAEVVSTRYEEIMPEARNLANIVR